MEKVTDEQYQPDRGPCNRANCHPHRTPSFRGPMLMIILVSYLMIVLDISIVITALPEIDQGFGSSYPGRGHGSKRNPLRVIHRYLIPL
jgi:hypothetical protein